MQPNEWTPPPIPASQPAAVPRRRRRGVVVGAGLVGAGVVAGAIVGGTVLSNAATGSPTPGSSSSASQPQDRHDPGDRGLPLSGTVTAVGSSTVTIKTSTGSTTYQVDSNSDIDKNGEAQLSSLKPGDQVRFSVTSGNVIDILHAGDEALDRPPGPGPNGSGG
jgi:ABC-type phosphate transport system substrate-binding protein